MILNVRLTGYVRSKRRNVPKHGNPNFECTVMPKEEKGGLLVPFRAPYRLLNLSTDLHETWYECYVIAVCGNNNTVDVVGVTPAAPTATPGPLNDLQK